MGPSRSQYLILTLFTFALGVLGVMALQANELAADTVGAEDRQARLIAIVENLEEKRSSLEGTLADLREEATAYEQEAASRRGLSRTYAQELARLRMLAGLVPVQGPGLEVVLADNPQPPVDGGDPNNYIIHDYDVRATVNALWRGGAEAIAVNDQRLVGSSAIRCVGTTILVNNTRVGSPFHVRATGDPERLKRALSADDDARLLLEEYAKLFGLKVEVEDHDDIELPAYGGSMTPRDLLSDAAEPTMEAMTQ